MKKEGKEKKRSTEQRFHSSRHKNENHKKNTVLIEIKIKNKRKDRKKSILREKEIQKSTKCKEKMFLL